MTGDMMTEAIIVFIYMNMGIVWALHRGTDVSTFTERLLIQLLIILWPLSMLFTLFIECAIKFERALVKRNRKKAVEALNLNLKNTK